MKLHALLSRAEVCLRGHRYIRFGQAMPCPFAHTESVEAAISQISTDAYRDLGFSPPGHW